MNSYRWYRLGVGRRPIRRAEVLALFEPRPESNCLFTLIRSDKSGIYADFSWRHFLILERIGEAGEYFEDRAEVRSSMQVSFRGSFTFALLRVVDGGRNIRVLIDALESSLGHGFFFESISFNEDLGASLESNKFLDSCKLVGAKVTDLRVADGVLSRMEFAARQGMSLSSIDSLRGKEFKVELMKYEVLKSGLRGGISFGKSGRVVASGGLEEFLVHFVESEVNLGL